MIELILSVFDHGSEPLAGLRTLLNRFEQLEDIHIQLEVIPWVQGWSRLVEVALYHSGPDVSEVGSSWVGDLVRMRSLHAFKQEEIDHITEMSRFFDSVWTTGSHAELDTAVHYSIPWSGDVRVVFYLNDVLEKAGVEAASAFQDAASFERTVAALQKKNVPMPLVLPTRRSNVTIHNLASWIWGAGGDFLSPNGKKVTFDTPEALQGFKSYFRLGRYLVPEARDLEETDADQMFMTGRAAIIPTGYWALRGDVAAPGSGHELGARQMPGGSYVGGHHLVVWEHCRLIPAAIKLIHFLHSDEAAHVLYPQFGLPISESIWSHPPFDAPNYQVLLNAFKTGRGFPSGGELWGLVEKRLIESLGDLWKIFLDDPQASIDAIVEERLTNLARRLQLSIEP